MKERKKKYIRRRRENERSGVRDRWREKEG